MAKAVFIPILLPVGTPGPEAAGKLELPIPGVGQSTQVNIGLVGNTTLLGIEIEGATAKRENGDVDLSG